ncbi:MAG: CPBP family intramembrane metalloprotease [Planctomycetota bacterium]|nr:CPBP family intramembrane metalloprotease [Planctomycetota bacterium]
MPDPTTPEDNLFRFNSESTPPLIEGAPSEALIEGVLPSVSRMETSDSTLSDEDRAEVAAYRGDFEMQDDCVAPISATHGSFHPTRRQVGLPCVQHPGPGIPEAIGWTVGVLVIHLIGMIVAVVAVLTAQVYEVSATGTLPSLAQFTSFMTSLPENFGLELMTGEMLVFLVIAVAATWLRLVGRTSHRLGIRPIPQQHFWLIVAVSIPISLMCGGLHELTVAGWDQWFAHLPGMEFFEHLNVNESIKPLGESAPLGLLLLVIAVAPAIGEEIIFRGIIGRGLIARHGIVAGVIMTSCLFAAVHIHPAHVVALLPLAFFIHLAYLTTKSFLAPMLLHFLNNALAVVLLKASATTEGLENAGEASLPLYLVLAAAGAVGLVGWVLWQSRVEYRLDDGSLWDPGYPTVEIPPESAGATVAYRECPSELYRGALTLAGAYSLVFAVSLGMVLAGHSPG